MRVITGSARGKKLETLAGNDVRPTTDLVKEAVFSIIQFQIEGRRFLDLFAGSGQMGIEALSRGAKSACFVDQSKRSLAVTKKNLANVGFFDRAKTVQADAQSFLHMNRDIFDIAFLDPPYDSDLIESCLSPLAEHMSKGGIIICETADGHEFPLTAGDFELHRQYRYGKTKIITYCHKDAEF